jgi:hypothetical protein
MARQWFRFAHGREEEADDEGSLKQAAAAFAAAGGDVRELLAAMVKTDAFRTVPAEVTR